MPTSFAHIRTEQAERLILVAERLQRMAAKEESWPSSGNNYVLS